MSEQAAPTITFRTFIVSLGQSGLVHLGEAAPPGAPGKQLDLPLARDTIDLLTILKEKTAGNLDDDETRLLEAILFDLRTRYLAATKG